MKRLVIAVLASVLMLGLACPLWAAGPSKSDAQAMVKKAITFLKANGKEKALAEFSNPTGQFVKGELYLTVWDFNGTQIAHGANIKLVGKNLIDLKDTTGKAFVKDFMAAGKKGNGWVDYKWTNPASKKIEVKHTYLEASGDMIIGAGVYE
jgi:signal transduction histidine kinase